MTRKFTLIEMLVVIAIIGILSAMLSSAVLNSLKSAHQTACLNNLKQLSYALNQYVNEREQFPQATNMPSQNLNDLPGISEALVVYADKQLFRCPGDDQNYFTNEESSYEWNTWLNNQKPVVKIFRNITLKPSDTRVMWDYMPFHGEGEEPGAYNIMYFDMTANSL